VFTLSCNLAGICGLSLPCGFVSASDGDAPLPVGLQIQGPAFEEESILRVAHAYEQATSWHRQRPPVF
jgi:aspartyl-tRNA(Asn)/glutamyl-tRNA(Gln) amidotransferase subunit A